jgi:hypothetical protein
VEPTVRLFELLWSQADGDDLDRLQYIDAALYLPADLLAKADRMSMAHSLEARVPFLDRRLVELCRRMPMRMRLRGLTSKHVLRNAMRDRLPATITRGRKRGFSAPMPAWFAGALREYTADMLSAQRLRRQGIFRPAAVARYIVELCVASIILNSLTLFVFSAVRGNHGTAHEGGPPLWGADAAQGESSPVIALEARNSTACPPGGGAAPVDRRQRRAGGGDCRPGLSSVARPCRRPRDQLSRGSIYRPAREPEHRHSHLQVPHAAVVREPRRVRLLRPAIRSTADRPLHERTK